MDAGVLPVPGKLEVTFTGRSIVKAVNPFAKQHQLLTLSNLDLLSGRFPITYFYIYRNSRNVSFSSIIQSLKSSLAQTLNYYYPFAGRILQNSTTREPEIICDNNGALLVESHANVPLKKLDLYRLDQSLQGKLVTIDPDFPFQVQATRFTCGGISIAFSFDHALGDASAFGKFLLSWSEIAQRKPISCSPDHNRNNLCARCPPTYHPYLDGTFVKCTLEDIMNIPTTNTLIKRLYHVDVSDINRLQQLARSDANSNNNKITKIEAFSAYLWKIMVTAIDERLDKCKMGWLIDGRGRIAQDSMSNYIGNVLSVAVGEASLEELKRGSLSDVARNVHEAISKVAKREHFLDLIDWIECHRPGLMLAKIVLGCDDGPALVLSSGTRFPVSELDFGFGRPVVGAVYSTIEKIGVGYLNQRPSARNDGSWTVSAIIWPELAAALESDSVFQPMSATHLHL